MTTTIRLDAEIDSRLSNLAHTTGRTKSFYLRELIMNGLDDLEDYYRAAVVMERVRNGKEPILTSDQVRRNLGLDD